MAKIDLNIDYNKACISVIEILTKMTKEYEILSILVQEKDVIIKRQNEELSKYTGEKAE